jgi:mono/diheme cytochrome c family protein
VTRAGLAVATAVAVMVGAGAAFALLPRRASFADADDAALVAAGEQIYAGQCAACHGARLEGQPHWERVGPDGRVPAPPQDETGHSWMHSDAELIRAVTRGTIDDEPGLYASDMPAFGDRLSGRDILAVLAFIKSRWPLGVRVYPALQNPGERGMPRGAAAADWSLPPNCGFEPFRAARSTP